jgi:prepilin-type N-terminal cleavage/methylation domain-containing protein
MKIKGYTIVELLIVIVIIGIMLVVASFSWQKYVANSNLKTGARKVAADFALYRARAIAEGRDYTITINIQPNNNYTIYAPATGGTGGLLEYNPAPVTPTDTPTDASQTQDAQITAVDFTTCSIIRFTARGLVEHCAVKPAAQNDYGTVTLTNRRGSKVPVEIDSRGRVDVNVKDYML